MNMKMTGLILSLVSSIAFFSIAETKEVAVKTINQYDIASGDDLSANLAHLSPTAIEMGLRDAEVLAKTNFDSKKNILTVQWHSISKTVNGSELAENFSEPLYSYIQTNNEVIPSRQELFARGDVDVIVDAYKQLLKKAETDIEVDNSKTTLDANKDNDYANSGGNSGSSSGGNGGISGLSDIPNEPTVDVNTDEIVESVEKCALRIDLEGGIVSRQERKISTSSNTGSTVEMGECVNTGQSYPIRKDFEAGCTLKLDKNSGKYQKGYKLYAMVDGSRFNLSECEWSPNEAITYYEQKDFDKCNISKSVIDASNNVYLPAFVKFTTIDGNRYDLTTCVTDKKITKPLPTETRSCDYNFDLVNDIAYEQTKIVTSSPKDKSLIRETLCSNTGKTYKLEKDFNVKTCDDLPDYKKSKLFLGYKKYFMLDGDDEKAEKKQYAESCSTDDKNIRDIQLITDDCEVKTDLIEKLTTIRKKWVYTNESGAFVPVSQCVETTETHPIVSTTESCTPKYIPEQKMVLIQGREGWQDKNNNWHFVTECRVFSDKLAVKSEISTDQKYEHDFVGGTSYLRTRDYYEWKGKRVYLNSFSRDPSVSFPHKKTSSGCPTKHDNGNLRSQLFTKTYATLEEGDTILSGCQAEAQYIPYQMTNHISDTKQMKLGVHHRGIEYYNPTIKQVCELGANEPPYSQGWNNENYTFIKKFNHPIMSYNPSANASPEREYNSNHSLLAWTIAYFKYDIIDWRRSDGSIYRQFVTFECRNKQ